MQFFTASKMASNADVLALIAEDNSVKFNIGIDFGSLIQCCDIDGMNSLIDDIVEDGYLLEALSYKPIGVDSMQENLVIIEVQADASSYLDMQHEHESEPNESSQTGV